MRATVRLPTGLWSAGGLVPLSAGGLVPLDVGFERPGGMQCGLGLGPAHMRVARGK